MGRGLIVQAIRARPCGRLTKTTASAALALFKAHLGLPRSADLLLGFKEVVEPVDPFLAGTPVIHKADEADLLLVPDDLWATSLPLSPSLSPSPPPMAAQEEGNESDVSLDGAMANLFSQPGTPAPSKVNQV
ncbi:hypothetical protein ColLi_14001 [Colletotrichum liriopes]|uniref:Uncharacterized protein n=1 Tax=Colletotrichum liriopes TaxID=708192 RepID=A0AA37H427_9PEZI|nr:hypothetical protein ColLi_14001 [Colletotrichum liriopes]